MIDVQSSRGGRLHDVPYLISIKSEDWRIQRKRVTRRSATMHRNASYC